MIQWSSKNAKWSHIWRNVLFVVGILSMIAYFVFKFFNPSQEIQGIQYILSAIFGVGIVGNITSELRKTFEKKDNNE